MKSILVLSALVILCHCSSLLGPDAEDTPINNFEVFWEDFDLHYALFDHRNVDWSSLYEAHRPRVNERTTNQQLFEILSDLVAPLNDRHITLQGMGRFFTSGGHLPVQENPFSLNTVKSNYLASYRTAGGGFLTYGRFDAYTGYLHISSFLNTSGGLANRVNDWAKDIDKVMKTFTGFDRVIIDVRNNGGGSPANAEHIAARFFDKKRSYCKVQYRNGPDYDDLTDPVTFSVKPEGGSRFTQDIAILTNRGSASAAERFVMAMRTLPYVTHVGDTTRGIFAENMERDLLNGWLYTLTHSIVQDINNICYEGVGLAPQHHAVNSDEALANGIDHALETALATF